jgi:hypothetical protein
MAKKPNRCIEPERGCTYSSDKFAVYEYGVYPRHSVLRGQTSRRYIEGGFKTVEEAKAAFPDAEVSVGSGYQAPSLSHLPDPDGPDPLGDNAAAAREHSHG